MPKSLLILIIAAVAGLSALTWSQFFRDPSTTPPVVDDGSGGQNGPALPVKGPDEPPVPVDFPSAVPIEEHASELLQAMVGGMLGDGDPVTYEDLARLRDTEAGVAELIRLLRTSQDDNVRAAALMILGQSRIEGAFTAVKEAALGGYGDSLQTAGIIGMLSGQEEAIPTLREIFTGTQDEGVAAATLQVLSHLDPDQALATFSDLLAVTSDETRRDTLYQILGGHIFPLETDEPEVMIRTRQTMVGLLAPEGDPDPEQAKVIDDVVTQLIREEDPKLQMASTIVLARMPGRKAEDEFVKRFKAADDDHKLGLLGLMHPELSRGKMNAILRLAPALEDKRQRDMLSAQLALWPNIDLADEVRVWRDREEDEVIRKRLDETIRRMGGR